jgi:hypothetical protein
VDESLRSFGLLTIVVAGTFKPSSLAQIVHLLDSSHRPLDISRGGYRLSALSHAGRTGTRCPSAYRCRNWNLRWASVFTKKGNLEVPCQSPPPLLWLFNGPPTAMVI